ncbi:MAG: hypothetical protein CMO81_06755 [Waddliaceae bacterium]|nr:hypothetical protein [Waddliaceae bacterium]
MMLNSVSNPFFSSLSDGCILDSYDNWSSDDSINSDEFQTASDGYSSSAESDEEKEVKSYWSSFTSAMGTAVSYAVSPITWGIKKAAPHLAAYGINSYAKKKVDDEIAHRLASNVSKIATELIQGKQPGTDILADLLQILAEIGKTYGKNAEEPVVKPGAPTEAWETFKDLVDRSSPLIDETLEDLYDQKRLPKSFLQNFIRPLINGSTEDAAMSSLKAFAENNESLEYLIDRQNQDAAYLHLLAIHQELLSIGNNSSYTDARKLVHHTVEKLCGLIDELSEGEYQSLDTEKGLRFPRHFFQNTLFPLIANDAAPTEEQIKEIKQTLLPFQNDLERTWDSSAEDEIPSYTLIRLMYQAFIQPLLESHTLLQRHNRRHNLAIAVAELIDHTLSENIYFEEFSIPKRLCSHLLFPILRKENKLSQLRNAAFSIAPTIDLALKQTGLYEENMLQENFIEQNLIPLLSSDLQTLVANIRLLATALANCIDKKLSLLPAYPKNLYKNFILPILHASTPKEALNRIQSLLRDHDFTAFIDSYLSRIIPQKYNPTRNFYGDGLRHIIVSTTVEDALLNSRYLIANVADPLDKSLRELAIQEKLDLPKEDLIKGVLLPLLNDSKSLQDFKNNGAKSLASMFVDPHLNPKIENLGLKDLGDRYAPVAINHNSLHGMEEDIFQHVIDDYNRSKFGSSTVGDASTWSTLKKVYEDAIKDITKAEKALVDFYIKEVLEGAWHDSYKDHRPIIRKQIKKPICLDRFLVMSPREFTESLNSPENRPIIILETYLDQEIFLSEELMIKHITIATLNAVRNTKARFEKRKGDTFAKQSLDILADGVDRLTDHMSLLADYYALPVDQREGFRLKHFPSRAIQGRVLAKQMFDALFGTHANELHLPQITRDFIGDLILDDVLVPKDADGMVMAVLRGAKNGIFKEADKEGKMPFFVHALENIQKKYSTGMPVENGNESSIPTDHARLQVLSDALNSWVQTQEFKNDNWVKNIVFTPVKDTIKGIFKKASPNENESPSRFKKKTRKLGPTLIRVRRPGVAKFLDKHPKFKDLIEDSMSNTMEFSAEKSINSFLAEDDKDATADDFLDFFRQTIEKKDDTPSGNPDEELTQALTDIVYKLDFLGRHDSFAGMSKGLIWYIIRKTPSVLVEDLVAKNFARIPRLGENSSKKISKTWKSVQGLIGAKSKKSRLKKARKEAEKIVDMYRSSMHDTLLCDMTTQMIQSVFASEESPSNG